MKLFGAHTSVSSRKIGNLRNITLRIAYNPQGKTGIARIAACRARAQRRRRSNRDRQNGCPMRAAMRSFGSDRRLSAAAAAYLASIFRAERSKTFILSHAIAARLPPQHETCMVTVGLQ
jgi:hypothetical protein